MNTNSRSEAYAAAGVDITAGYRAVELMKKHIGRTEIPGVCSDVGGFGGLFEPDIGGMSRPVLVSGTDGVGTKLKIAFLTGRHDTIGIDCVAMCVNDIICCGAKPLFFLDYIACGKNVPETIEQIVKGVCEGCVQAGCALIGGETAEHPGMMPEDEYDLAGYATGIVDREKMIDNRTMKAGDVIIALQSTGVHSNGFSLVRKVFDVEHADLAAPLQELGGRSLGEALLEPTRIYVKPVLALLKETAVKGISHITGGGFYENIPEQIEQIVKGVCEGCVQAGCALIGGETAEHPGLMPEDEYDLAGYCTGIVDKAKIIDNSAMRPGDVVIALPSTGVHSNGFSLVRKVFDVENADLKAPVAELGGRSLGEALLEPTRIYVKPVLALLKEVAVKGISHITGGGFYENIPRSIPDGLGAKIDRSKVRVLPVFDLIAKKGGVSERDMFNTYNMGVGMSLVVAPEDAEKALAILKEQGEDAYLIGEIVESEEKITIV